MHIGLIAGMEPAAGAQYYRKLAGAFTHAEFPLELTLVHTNRSLLVANLNARDPIAQAREFARLGKRLKNAGAESMAITSFAGHFCLAALEPITPLPIINGLRAVSDTVSRKRLVRVGLLGTASAMESALYGSLEQVEVVLPEGEMFRSVHEHYEATERRGFAADDARAYLCEAGAALCARGAEAIVLGGTDLFLAYDENPGYPVFDAADAHIDAIYRAALG